MSNASGIPAWVSADLFEKVLHETVPNFRKIQNFQVGQALAPGENYATVMLKVHIECLLQNGNVEKHSFMLKVPHDSELYRTELIKWEMFETEAGMYREMVPQLEELYHAKGERIRFGAKAYALPVSEEYILLEDLSRRGFRNVRRQDCLDMTHCKAVLRKMAQLHAASAVWVERNGPFPELYQKGMIRKEGKGLLGTMLTDGMTFILKTTKRLKNHSQYYEQLEQFSQHLMEVVFEQNHLDENDFNVLNHGDCWSNNIMFQYNSSGELVETYFVDLQIPRYGNPAQDLVYFLLSSAQYDLKIKCFDELIRHYHENLIEHLKLLEYRQTLPRLRDLHQMIIKSGIWGIITTIVTMAAVLCDRTDTATVDNFVGGSDESKVFKELLYSNDRFVQHWEIVLPWLCNRGAFEV